MPLEIAPRVQIVIPVRGAHEALRLCLKCVDEHTLFRLATGADRVDVESLLVCAEDEREAVAALGAHPDNRVVTTPAPQSFAANCNLGASRSRSEFLVLLNSDAFVGPGWLDALLAPFADPDVVAVGPMGTNVSGHQCPSSIAHGRSGSVDDVADCAAKFSARHSGAAPYPARRLVGFCLAVRREAWDRVGGLDEAFMNAFEDDAISLRLSFYGKLLVVPDLLVVHAGSASFAELPDAEANYRRTLEEGERVYRDRYGWLLPFWNQWCKDRGMR